MKENSHVVNFEKWRKRLGLLAKTGSTEILKLYSPFAHKVQGFFDASPSRENGYNNNQQAAALSVSTYVLSQSEGGWIHITGPMDSGKSASLVLSGSLLKKQRSIVAACHAFDKDRTKGIPQIMTHGNGNGLQAQQYSTIEEIGALVKAAAPGTVLLGDELHFAQGASLAALSRLRKLVRQRSIYLISAGLDMTFSREAWTYTRPILQVADQVLVLTARCQASAGQCEKPAVYSQRLVEGKPARRTDPIILVGKTQHYHAACASHHQVGD